MRTIDHCFYIVLANSIAKHHKHFIILYNTFSHPHRMSKPQSFSLMNKMCPQLGMFLTYIIPDFVAKVTHDKNNLINTGLLYLFNDYAKHCLSRKWDQCFGLGVSVWT